MEKFGITKYAVQKSTGRRIPIKTCFDTELCGYTLYIDNMFIKDRAEKRFDLDEVIKRECEYYGLVLESR